MATPALNFVAVCANASLPVQGNKNQFLKSLKESGASIGSAQSLPDIKERFAALTWVRHAVANAIPPRGLLRSALLFLITSVLSTRFRQRDRMLRPAKRTYIGWHTWSPCSSRPPYLLLPLLPRLPQRLPPVAASILRARRLPNKLRRPPLRRPLLPSRLRRSLTLPERNAG